MSDVKQVNGTNYSLSDNMQAKNVKSMNEDMGYNSMEDLANTRKFPVEMKGAKRATQPGADMPKNNRY